MQLICKSSVVCVSQQFDYNRDADIQHIPLRILWGDRENYLDNPSGILGMQYFSINILALSVCAHDPLFLQAHF